MSSTYRRFHQLLMLPACLLIASAARADCAVSDAAALVAAMNASYAGVRDYRTIVEVKEYSGGDGSYETKRFLYTFQKPNHIRLEFTSPHKGMVLIYPDDNGKVEVVPSGPFSFLTLHLSPDNRQLRVSAGQRIDQTDMGLLIRNISHSLTDGRRGEEEISEGDGHIRIGVVAENHFVRGKITRYVFFVDKKLCLPTRIEESSPGGALQRTIVFHDLQVNREAGDHAPESEGEGK